MKYQQMVENGWEYGGAYPSSKPTNGGLFMTILIIVLGLWSLKWLFLDH